MLGCERRDNMAHDYMGCRELNCKPCQEYNAGVRDADALGPLPAPKSTGEVYESGFADGYAQGTVRTHWEIRNHLRAGHSMACACELCITVRTILAHYGLQN